MGHSCAPPWAALADGRAAPLGLQEAMLRHARKLALEIGAAVTVSTPLGPTVIHVDAFGKVRVCVRRCGALTTGTS